MAKPPTLEDLQGTWKLVSMGQKGGKAPFFIPWLVKGRLVVEGDKYTRSMRDNVFETGQLTVTPMSDYAHIDQVAETGDDAGKTQMGLIRWVGNKLEHLESIEDGERPEGYPYTSESHCGYALMKRVKS